MAVIDTSVIVAVLLGEAEAVQAEDELLAGVIDIPDILPLEVANALVNAVRRGRIAAAEVAPRLAIASGMVATRHASGPLIERATAIALAYQRRPYDGVYLALAELLDTEVLTLDRKLVQGLKGTPLAHRVRLLAG